MLSRFRVLNSVRRFSALNVTNNLQKRNYSKDHNDDDDHNKKHNLNVDLGALRSKYQSFKDDDQELILDVYEEKLKYNQGLEALEKEKDYVDPFKNINIERGTSGVFEIDDLISLLKRDNAENIFVVAIPPDLNYVDYMCIVTGKSQRHMLALAEFTRRVYKKKKHKNDPLPKIEGENSKDWIAMDLGNIALHIFSKEARDHYDLETLWSVGPEFDAETKKQDPVVELLEKHSIYLKDLQPAS